MRVLFIDFTLPYLLRDGSHPVGGWAVQLNEWLHGFAQLGIRPGVMTFKGANKIAGPQSLCDLVETFDPARGITVVKYFYSYLPSMLSAARAWRPDVMIQSSAGVHTAMMAFVASRLDVPFVHRIASDVDSDERCRDKLRWYEHAAFRYGLRHADLIICQNGYQKGRLHRDFPAKPLYLLANVIGPVSHELGTRPRTERSYVAWLGVFRKPKNMALLERVARRMPQREFRIAGTRAESVDQETEAALTALETLPNVRFVGYLGRSDVVDFLSRATALLCTSHYEGFSNTFLEALWAGTPIVTRSGVDPDSLVGGGKLGRVAETEDQLVSSLEELQTWNAAEFDQLSRRCRSFIEGRQSPARAMQELTETLEHTIVRRQSRRH